ncbi:MAG: hypothetical protein M1840_003393 [Geoglossum simile]|nr:MAG: hypothetical protein M1840_003393 [Geoglossum simile]
MRFLRDRQGSTSSRLHERLEEKEWRSKDRDIERHGKMSSYFSTTQRTLEEDPSTLNTRKLIPLSKDPGGREIYRTPGEVPLAHSTSESALWPSLGRVSGLKDAPVSGDQRPSTVVGLDGDTVSEVTGKFAWSISNRSEAPLDVSTNGSLARITSSPFPKVAADKERINYGATHERYNQDGELAPKEGELATHVRTYSRVNQGLPVDRNGAFGKGAIVEENGLPIPDTDSQSRPRTASWMRSRTDGQHALDLDSDGAADKSSDQSSPPSATVFRDCDITARIPRPKDNAEDSLIAAASCGVQVHLGQRARPTAELAASTSAPIGVSPDTRRAGLVARPQSGPSEEMKQVSSTNPLPAWGGGHQYGGPNYYDSSGLVRLHRGKENIDKPLQPPSPHVSRPTATERAPPSSRKSQEGSLNEFYSRSAVQQYLKTRVHKSAPGDPLLSNGIEDPGDIPWLRSCITLGPATVDMVESGHSQQSRYRDNSLTNPSIYSLDHIPNNTVSVSSEDRNNDDSRAEQCCSKPYSTMHGESSDPQPEDPRTVSRFLEDTSLGIRGFRWDQGQRPQDNSTIRRGDVFQTQTDAVIGMSMGTFWRPHRLY